MTDKIEDQSTEEQEIKMNAEDFDRFVDVLDSKEPNPAFESLLNRPKRWEN